MTKADLIEKVQSARQDLSKRQVADVVDAVFDNLSRAIRREKRFSMPGFGTFVVKRRAARVGRNPQTGAAIEIAPTKTVGFKPAPELKKAL
jgi:DNA-binding protein HU-beta